MSFVVIYTRKGYLTVMSHPTMEEALQHKLALEAQNARAIKSTGQKPYTIRGVFQEVTSYSPFEDSPEYHASVSS